MKRKTIKEAFKIWDEEQKLPILPKNHEQRFLKRLKTQDMFKKRRLVFKWAAIALLCIGLSQTFWSTLEKPSQEVLKFQKAEGHLTFLINQQLTQIELVDLPRGKCFIEDYKTQMKRIQNDYEELYSQWESNPNQSKFIQALLANLNIQMDLLNELQKQITNIQKLQNENDIL